MPMAETLPASLLRGVTRTGGRYSILPTRLSLVRVLR